MKGGNRKPARSVTHHSTMPATPAAISEVGRRQSQSNKWEKLLQPWQMSPAVPTAHLSFRKILELTPRRIVYRLTQGLARVKSIINAPSHNPQVLLLKIPTAFPISFIFLYAEYSANGIFRFMMISVRPSTRTPAYQNSMRRSKSETCLQTGNFVSSFNFNLIHYWLR